MKDIKGSCLCGALQYTCDSAPLLTAVCHCSACQKSTGSSFSVVLVVKKAAFHLQGVTLKTYSCTGDSGSAAHRHFCSQCGTTIFAEIAARPDAVMIKAGTLDDPSWLQPQAHVYWRDHQSWIETLSSLPRHETTIRK